MLENICMDMQNQWECYELCQGEFDMNVCEIPTIDFMIDKDDDTYYQKI